MTRKPIQIVVNNGTEIVALCNDGTVWGMSEGSWWQMNDIPQPAIMPEVLYQPERPPLAPITDSDIPF